MTGVVVLDASALLAIALNEPGGEKVVECIRSVHGNVFIHAVNVFEVVSKLLAKGFSESEAWESARLGGIQWVREVGKELLRNAVRLKKNNPPLSLGDCFCLALAEDVEGCALTSDRGFAAAKTSAKVTLFRTGRSFGARSS